MYNRPPAEWYLGWGAISNVCFLYLTAVSAKTLGVKSKYYDYRQ